MFNLILTLFLSVTSSFYTLSFTSITGESIALQSFQGKKVLLVTIASGSRYVQQLGELEQLQQAYKGKLVIIGFPSNSFGKEPLEDAAIQALYRTQYGVSFLLAQKAAIAGNEQQVVFRWLTHQSENGVMEGPVSSDFHKYLVDEQGQLLGAWAPGVSPLDNSIKEALAN